MTFSRYIGTPTTRRGVTKSSIVQKSTHLAGYIKLRAIRNIVRGIAIVPYTTIAARAGPHTDDDDVSVLKKSPKKPA
jgi:hypothetical protein